MGRRTSEETRLKLWEGEYAEAAPLAALLCEQLESQLQGLVNKNAIVLGFPIQRRVKTWESVQRKLPTLPKSVKNLRDLQDLAGLRLVLQFTRDVDKVTQLLDSTLDVVRKYDTFDRLKEDQFGYSSIHFVVRVPESWLTVPTMSALKGVLAEIQVRTLSQHIWAAASHTLQYKSEISVPPTLRRSIYRVSALLETVDLELDRLLEARDAYRSEIEVDAPDPKETLNSDSLAKLMGELLPADNLDDDEEYSAILGQLRDAGIHTANDLRAAWVKHRTAVMKRERKHVQSARDEMAKGSLPPEDEERTLRGVYFTHSGLMRIMLAERSNRRLP